MQITKINDLYSATGQINTDDLGQISENGFKTIICFRPQDEDKENQPKHDTLKKEAKKRGIGLFVLILSIVFLYYQLLKELGISF